MMQNLILSTVPIPELVSMITAEVVKQIQQYVEKPIQIESTRLFGDKEAAKYLGCSPLTVFKLRKSGQIGYYRFGRKFYFLSNELDETLKVPRRFNKTRGNRHSSTNS